MAGIKIVDLPAVGRDLAATDLFEMSLVGGTGSRKITGQEIMNASKLSVGSTPVINGTIGRILFEGAGNVLQESSSLFWDNTNARLGIGTSTPTTPLDVNGAIKALTGSTIASFGINTGQITYGGYNTSISGFSNQFFIINASSTGYIQLQTQGAAGTIRFATGTSAAERMRISETGNILINTTTDAGFRLDVNGTARVKGTGTTSATTSFTVQNSAGTTMLSVKDGGFDKVVTMASALIGQIEITGLQFGAGGGNTISFPYNPITIGGTLANASALFQIDSTTKGFLPPRMTQTQRDAIASPAIGLEIYQTDATEGKYIYKSSGWTYIG